ncbi:MAG: hypothetical protein QM680_13625 [Luteolibacter sp.]
MISKLVMPLVAPLVTEPGETGLKRHGGTPSEFPEGWAGMRQTDGSYLRDSDDNILLYQLP